MTPRVFVLRHGHSVANELRLIASSPASASEAFGLTPLGETQIRETVTRAFGDGLLDRRSKLICSPLLRARQSATVATEAAGIGSSVDARLTERGFGELDLQPDDRYERVWTQDRRDPTHHRWGVESVSDVLKRAGSVVAEHTSEGDTSAVVLCTHGDVASALICASFGIPLERHREVGALETGALRELTSVSSLTEALG